MQWVLRCFFFPIFFFLTEKLIYLIGWIFSFKKFWRIGNPPLKGILLFCNLVTLFLSCGNRKIEMFFFFLHNWHKLACFGNLSMEQVINSESCKGKMIHNYCSIKLHLLPNLWNAVAAINEIKTSLFNNVFRLLMLFLEIKFLDIKFLDIM